jgi:hypothetical protein
MIVLGRHEFILLVYDACLSASKEGTSQKPFRFRLVQVQSHPALGLKGVEK